MCAGFRFDQLRSDAHPPAALSDRAFEDVAHTQLAADPLYGMVEEIIKALSRIRWLS